MNIITGKSHFRGSCVQASVELGPEDVSLLERCPHFRGSCVQASVELEPEDVSLLERCPHFRGCCVEALGPDKYLGISHVSDILPSFRALHLIVAITIQHLSLQRESKNTSPTQLKL